MLYTPETLKDTAKYFVKEAEDSGDAVSIDFHNAVYRILDAMNGNLSTRARALLSVIENRGIEGRNQDGGDIDALVVLHEEVLEEVIYGSSTAQRAQQLALEPADKSTPEALTDLTVRADVLNCEIADFQYATNNVCATDHIVAAQDKLRELTAKLQGVLRDAVTQQIIQDTLRRELAEVTSHAQRLERALESCKANAATMAKKDATPEKLTLEVAKSKIASLERALAAALYGAAVTDKGESPCAPAPFLSFLPLSGAALDKLLQKADNLRQLYKSRMTGPALNDSVWAAINELCDSLCKTAIVLKPQDIEDAPKELESLHSSLLNCTSTEIKLPTGRLLGVVQYMCHAIRELRVLSQKRGSEPDAYTDSIAAIKMLTGRGHARRYATAQGLVAHRPEPDMLIDMVCWLLTIQDHLLDEREEQRQRITALLRNCPEADKLEEAGHDTK